MASKIEKTLARQKQKIAEGQYYEAHQHLRVITSRYLSSSPPNYTSAIDLLFEGALLLLQAGKTGAAQASEASAGPITSETVATSQNSGASTSSTGSGADLAMYLVDVYKRSETKVDAESRGRILRLLRAFPSGEPMRKRFLGESVGWSSKYGSYPAGHPELHHVAGQLLLSETDPYDCERHLLLGTRDSPSLLASLESTWYASDPDPSTAPLYLARAVLPYLLLGNLRAANQCHLLFTSKLPASLPSENVGAANADDARIYPSLPLLNFLTLLLVAVQRGTGARQQFIALKTRYKPYLADQADGSWDEPLSTLGEMYFGVRIPKPMGNPLMDMMGSMFGGAMGGGGGGGGAGRGRAPPALGVD